MPVEIKFGTDGWRGIIADDYTYDSVRIATQGIAQYLVSRPNPSAIVGYDTRFSSDLFAREVSQVLAANGISVHLIDAPAPTQVSTYAILDKKASGGLVITASHNPYYFSGLKYKPEYAGSASPEVTNRLEEEIQRVQRGGRVRQVRYDDAVRDGRIAVFDPKPAYVAQVNRLVNLDRIKAAGLRILHEPMYGASQGYVRALLSGGKTTVEEIHQERNPGFGGMHPEPIAQWMPEALERMSSGRYDLGIANDGDADRVGIIDERGQFINQLQVMALLMMYLVEKRGQKGDVVRSLTSTSMADRLGERFGVKVHEMPVGFKYLGPKMAEVNAILAGEESGGFAFRGHIPERDGVLSGIMFADMIVDYGKPLSKILDHLVELVGPHFYARHDLHLERDEYPARRQEIYGRLQREAPTELAGGRIVRSRTDDGFKYYLEDGSWVLIRFSGTEPLIRVYSEASSKERVDQLLAALEEQLGLRQLV
ncbi:MAG TPA: phosphoglucomutase/phosphomannomutase family protein [Candidatus Dormibacteraeota bacterium]|nr:phosphoglucomutase/phosphomannomutase family protein [Candidatus Dormibacteraeota bacterium]